MSEHDFPKSVGWWEGVQLESKTLQNYKFINWLIQGERGPLRWKPQEIRKSHFALLGQQNNLVIIVSFKVGGSKNKNY